MKRAFFNPFNLNFTISFFLENVIVISLLIPRFTLPKNKIKGKDEIKEKSTISLGDLMQDIDNMSESDIKNICNDIKSMNLFAS